MNLLVLTAHCAVLISACRAAPSTGGPRAVCPDQLVEARVGQDVLLPCRVEPEADLLASTVDWQRDNRIVFCRRNGRVNYADQEERYRGRADMSPEGPGRGDLTLQLRSVNLSDSGRYKCNVPKRTNCTLYLNVTKATQGTSDGPVFTTSPPLDQTNGSPVPDEAHLKTVQAVVPSVCIPCLFIVAGLVYWKRETIKERVMGWKHRVCSDEEMRMSTEMDRVMTAPPANGVAHELL